MRKTTASWVRKAESDYATARGFAVDEAGSRDAISVHCRQSIEKYLKALLVNSGAPCPKTHDVEQLFALALPHHGSLKPFRTGVLFLSTFAEETRSPTFEVSKRQAMAALRWAKQVRTKCRALLGLRDQVKRGMKQPSELVEDQFIG
jgi:HEPN domain-containing protein